MLGHRRSYSGVEEELKRAECRQTKTDPSLAQVLDDSEDSRVRKEIVRGRERVSMAALKMVAM